MAFRLTCHGEPVAALVSIEDLNPEAGGHHRREIRLGVHRRRPRARRHQVPWGVSEGAGSRHYRQECSSQGNFCRQALGQAVEPPKRTEDGTKRPRPPVRKPEAYSSAAAAFFPFTPRVSVVWPGLGTSGIGLEPNSKRSGTRSNSALRICSHVISCPV